jgi:3-phosphoglycerate kinase
MKKTKLIALTGVLLLVLIFIYYINNQIKIKSTSSNISEDTKQLVDKVSKLIILPKDELPTVAIVSDPEKLKNQAFFAKAKNGDRVLIYTASKRAYLYDPVANKILEVAPIDFGDIKINNKK